MKGILLRRALPSSLSPENSTAPNFKTGSWHPHTCRETSQACKHRLFDRRSGGLFKLGAGDGRRIMEENGAEHVLPAGLESGRVVGDQLN